MSPLGVYLLYISPLFHYSWLFGYTTRTSETLCSRSCTNVWLGGTRWQPDKSEAKWFTCGKRSPLLLGVAHPHTMRVQSVLTEREVQIETRRERETAESDVGRRGNEEGVLEGKGRKRRWGSSDTGNGKRTGQGKCTGWMGRCGGGYKSKSSVGTQVEYFSNIMAEEPLSAPVIRCVCVAEPFSSQKETSGSRYSTSRLHRCQKNRTLMSICSFLSVCSSWKMLWLSFYRIEIVWRDSTRAALHTDLSLFISFTE